MTRISLCLLALAFLLHAPPAAAEPLEIRVPRVVEGYDPRADYPLSLIRLAMEKAGVAYRLSATDRVVRQDLVVDLMAAERDVTLFWLGATPEREAKLRPVPVPIYRGLLGHRLLIIHRDRESDFAAVTGLEDLSLFLAGQGYDWADAPIMRAAGLPVDQSKYSLLFRQVAAGRIDYFPRGATEIFAEMQRYGADLPELTVEPNLLLVYPFDLFFHTQKQDVRLAEALERGLTLAYEDGSFMDHFYGHPKVVEVLRAAELDDRLRIEIPNPLLSKRFRAIPERYWHRPGDNGA